MRVARLGRHRLQDQRRVALRAHDRHRVIAVLDRPARRRRQREVQVRVQELLSPHQPLRRAVAEDHALDRLQEGGAVLVHRLPGGQLRGLVADALQALLVARVRGQPVVARLRLATLCPRLVGGELLLVLQHLDHVDHVPGVVAVARQVLGAELVRLQLLLAAVGGDVAGRGVLRELPGDVRRAAHAARLQHRAQHRRGEHADAGVLLARRPLRAVARGHVADLVAHDAGQVGLVLHVGQDAPGDVDITARQREGIDLRAVEHGEMPLELGPVRLRGELVAQRGDVGLQPRVIDDRVLLEHALVGLAAGGHLLLQAHRAALGAAGDRVDDLGAAAGDRQQGGGGQHRERKVALHRINSA